MYLSIIGSARSGKSMLFSALSGLGSGSGTMAVIDVPDDRLRVLADIFRPKKIIHARIELSDTVAIEEGDMKKEAVSAKMLQQMRSSDAYLLVLRAYDTSKGSNPLSEFRTIIDEFIISDMMQIEKRLERIDKQSGKKDLPLVQQEISLLGACLAHLNEGKPLSTLAVVKENEKDLRGFQFLSQKPMMVVVNCGESDDNSPVNEGILAEVRRHVPEHVPVIAACAKLESELACMPAQECAEFMAEYGISESVRGRIIRLACETLGLISFLTVGDDECRAWPIRRGMTAQEAAGTIHTDFYQKFIRAETVAYDEFIKHNGFAGCKKAGVWRLEGKNYVVQEGDILSIRAGN
jgi:GTP-binding protein YchF